MWTNNKCYNKTFSYVDYLCFILKTVLVLIVDSLSFVDCL